MGAVVGLLIMAFGVFTILGAFGVVPVTVAPALRGSEWSSCAADDVVLVNVVFCTEGATLRLAPAFDQVSMLYAPTADVEVDPVTRSG